jgi:hypothetical protein
MLCVGKLRLDLAHQRHDARFLRRQFFVVDLAVGHRGEERVESLGLLGNERRIRIFIEPTGAVRGGHE